MKPLTEKLPYSQISRLVPKKSGYVLKNGVHANDVSFLLDYPHAERLWSLLYKRTTPSPWQYEMADIWKDNYATFFATQKPLKSFLGLA